MDTLKIKKAALAYLPSSPDREDELPPRLLLVKVTEDTNRRRLHCFKDEEKEKEPETFKSEFVVDGETIRPRRRRSSMTRGIYSDWRVNKSLHDEEERGRSSNEQFLSRSRKKKRRRWILICCCCCFLCFMLISDEEELLTINYLHELKIIITRLENKQINEV